MSLSLPLASSPLRELFSVAALADIASPVNRSKIASLRMAKQWAKGEFSDPAVHSVNGICFSDATGELWLVQFGKKGGHKRLWNFGTL